jgi:hypothetical protein
VACKDFVSGCFGHDLRPFAVDASDRHRALAYLECLVEHRVSWEEAREQVRGYLTERGAVPQHITMQIDMARLFLKPWLAREGGRLPGE